jgi:hypothetical protein
MSTVVPAAVDKTPPVKLKPVSGPETNGLAVILLGGGPGLPGGGEEADE